MRVKLLKVIKGSGLFITYECRQTRIVDGDEARAIQPGREYVLAPLTPDVSGPRSGVVGPMSRTTVDQASLDELLDEIKRRARGSV